MYDSSWASWPLPSSNHQSRSRRRLRHGENSARHMRQRHGLLWRVPDVGYVGLEKLDHSRRDQAGWSSPWVLLQSIHRDISDFRPARDLRLRVFSNIHRLPRRHNIKRRPRLAPTWEFWRVHILPTCDGRTCGEHDGIFAESKGRVAAAWE